MVSAADVEILRKEVKANAGWGTQGRRRGVERRGPGGSRQKAMVPEVESQHGFKKTVTRISPPN